MVTAFGLLSPIAMVSYKTYEQILGLGHNTVKYMHATLQSAAALLGTVIRTLDPPPGLMCAAHDAG